jgi:hypothetical protein
MDIQKPSAKANLRAPYSVLKRKIESAIDFEQYSEFSVYDLMAMCIHESMGLSTFCACDRLYKDELSKILKETGVPLGDFLECVKIVSGINKNGLAKFFFRKQWFDEVQADENLAHLSLAMRVLFSCSIGIGQMSVKLLCLNQEEQICREVLAAFIADDLMQIRQLQFWLSGFLKGSNGDKAIAYTKYGEKISARLRENLGERVVELSDKLRDAYAASEHDKLVAANG